VRKKIKAKKGLEYMQMFKTNSVHISQVLREEEKKKNEKEKIVILMKTDRANFQRSIVLIISFLFLSQISEKV
jgi:hypothetical protein